MVGYRRPSGAEGPWLVPIPEPIIFWASLPYVPFVPIGGLETELFFYDQVSNEALIELRHFIVGFIEKSEPDTPQIWQWERNIEL